LEEEASRKIDEKDNKIYYSLERLGIPLIEVSTSPDISSPKEAREVAKNLGMLIRRIGKIQRDVDSIRQDLNISINGGNRVEIKGVQSLSAIETVLENEIKRQKSLIDISQILKQRGLNQDDIRIEFIDIAHEAIKWNSNIIRKGIEQGNKIFIFKLPKLKGLLKNGNYRLGKELADRLRVIGIGGMIHSDELPANGINESIISWIRQILNLEENDAFGIIAIPESKSALVKNILEERVAQSLGGVPAETRAAIGDETRFMRPLPGSSRMYPETDIPLIIITKEMLEKNIKDLPKGVDERIKMLESLGIPKQEAMVSLDLGLDEIIEEIVKKYGNPTVASSFINRVRPKEKDKEKLNIIFNLLNQGKIPKEALDTLYQYPEKLEELITSSKQTPQLENRIREIVQARRELILERGENAFKPIMGEVMKEMRGKLEGQIISKIVRDEIDRLFTKNNSI
jgi:Archaeal Glu-tRNAGln amidotransferase subunit E (contains GAD domain)